MVPEKVLCGASKGFMKAFKAFILIQLSKMNGAGRVKKSFKYPYIRKTG